MNMIDITPIVNAVIALLAAGVSVFLIPWIKSKTTDAQRKELLEWVKIGVDAAEQLYEGRAAARKRRSTSSSSSRPWASLWTRRPSTRPSRRQSTSSTAATCRSNNQQRAGQHGPPFILQRRHKDMSENKKPALNMRYYNGEIDDDLPYTGVLNYDEETGLIYDEDGDVVDEKTLDAMLDGDGKGDDEDE